MASTDLPVFDLLQDIGNPIALINTAIVCRSLVDSLLAQGNDAFPRSGFKTKYKKYFFGGYLSADFGQKLWL